MREAEYSPKEAMSLAVSIFNRDRPSPTDRQPPMLMAMRRASS
jgi:hypothetical protein